MAAFTFSGLGDIVALAQAAKQVHCAIDDRRGVARQLRTSMKELDCFLKICGSIERTVVSSATVDPDDLAVFEACHQCLVDFKSYLERFDDKRDVMRIIRRIRLALFEKEKIPEFESRMRGYTGMLSIIQAKYCSEDLKIHLARSLDGPWDQKPMQFQDALGRRYPVPLEVCSSFEGFLNFLQFAFAPRTFLKTAIQRQQFWLFTPELSKSKSWYIIHEGDWASIARPGTQLGMSFLTSREQESTSHPTLTRCGSGEPISKDNDATQHAGREIDEDWFASGTSKWEDSSIPSTEANQALSPEESDDLERSIRNLKFGKPMPPWGAYDPDTNFQLLSPLRRRLPSPMADLSYEASLLSIASCPCHRPRPRTREDALSIIDSISQGIQERAQE